MTFVNQVNVAILDWPWSVVHLLSGFTFPTWQPIDRITNPEKPRSSKINIYRQI